MCLLPGARLPVVWPLQRARLHGRWALRFRVCWGCALVASTCCLVLPPYGKNGPCGRYRRPDRLPPRPGREIRPPGRGCAPRDPKGLASRDKRGNSIAQARLGNLQSIPDGPLLSNSRNLPAAGGAGGRGVPCGADHSRPASGPRLRDHAGPAQVRAAGRPSQDIRPAGQFPPAGGDRRRARR